MRSSFGFHTLTVSIPVPYPDRLISDFKQYSKANGNIQIYSEKKDSAVKVKFYKGNYRGISWQIRAGSGEYGTFPYYIYATINPKILAGINDYTTAATYRDIEAAIINFNKISWGISPQLRTFDSYRLTRIDYCINFYIKELVAGCTVEQIMKLIKRSPIPPNYKEWKKYDVSAHRTKSRLSSFYLIKKSININCYSKYMQLKEKSKELQEHGYPPIPDSVLNAAKYIIRFEVQCKYPKIYSMSKKAEAEDNYDINKYDTLLQPDVCENILKKYYCKMIGTGDWYDFQSAKRIISSHDFNSQKEKRLIDALYIISQCRSVQKAKEVYTDSGQLDSFNQTLKDYSILGINPVIIPKEWGIKRIPNLLQEYHILSQIDRRANDTDNYFGNFELNEYLM